MKRIWFSSEMIGTNIAQVFGLRRFVKFANFCQEVGWQPHVQNKGKNVIYWRSQVN